MVSDPTERRRHPRFHVTRAIYIEVVARGSRSEADNLILRCETIDISVGGLRIRVPQEIALGSKLNVAVPMDEWKENLELSGKVMWTGEAEDKVGYWLGIELEDSSPEDMRKWYEVVQYLQAQHKP